MARKRCFSLRWLLLHLLFILLLSFMMDPAIATADDTDNVKDDLNYLSTDELGRIQSEIDRAVRAYNMDLVLVITDQTQGKSSRDFADDYYDYNGYGIGSDASGLLLLINMDIREVWISTTGKAIDIFTNSRIDSILDEVALNLSEDDYFNACMVFISQVESYAQSGVPQGQYRQDENAEYSPGTSQDADPRPGYSLTYWDKVMNMIASPIIYIIALIIAIMATVIASSGNKGKVTVSNRTYEEGGSFHLTNKRDDFINQTVTRVRIANNNTSGSSSGGRSNVHRGSSGRSHGGGGRRF